MGIENTEAFSLLQMNNHPQFFFKLICCRKIINICVLNAQMKGFSDSTPSPGCLPEDNHVYFPLRCTPLCTSEQQCWRVQQGCIEKQTLTAIICKGQSVTLWSLGSCMKNVSFQRDTRPKIKAAQPIWWGARVLAFWLMKYLRHLISAQFQLAPASSQLCSCSPG